MNVRTLQPVHSPTRRRCLSRRRFLQLCLGAGGAGVVADSFWLAPRRLRVTRHRVALAGLPQESDGMTVAQMSDFHRGPYVDDAHIRAAVDLCNAQRADLIVLTGDFVSRSERYAAPCAGELSRLQARLGAFAVLGNHDYWEDAPTVTKALTDKGIRVLVNESAVVSGLRLAGVDDMWAGSPDLLRTLRGVDAEQPFLLLSHNPRILPQAAPHNCVILCGHTHGGQVAIPFLPRLLPSDMQRTGAYYPEGWYRQGRARMYVNRGIGVIAPPVRFRCPPEISMFTLTAAAASDATPPPQVRSSPPA